VRARGGVSERWVERKRSCAVPVVRARHLGGLGVEAHLGIERDPELVGRDAFVRGPGHAVRSSHEHLLRRLAQPWACIRARAGAVPDELSVLLETHCDETDVGMAVAVRDSVSIALAAGASAENATTQTTATVREIRLMVMAPPCWL
jgi:hypothetical protein